MTVMPIKIVRVYADDWEGLYVDGKLVTEEHSLRIRSHGKKEVMMATARKVTPAQIAYAALWRSQCTDKWSRAARQALLDSLTKEERRDAIAWLLEAFGL